MMRLIFSLPKPLGATVSFTRLPGTMRVCSTAGGIVAGIHTPERVGNDRAAKISLGVALGNARIDRFLKAAADKVHFLPHLGKDDRHAGILTNRDIQLLGGGDIILDSLQYAAGQAAFLARGALGYPALKLLRQALIGADAKLCDRLLDERNIDLSHIITR